MALPRIPVFLAYVVAGVLPLALVPTLRRNREKPGGTGVLLVVVGSSIWGLAFGVGYLIRTPPVGFVSANVVLVGAVLSILGWVLAIGEYSGVLSLSRPLLGVLLVEPLVILSLAWTDPIHHLFYVPGVDFYATSDLSSIYGPAFWAHTAYSYVLIGGGVLVAVSETITAQGVRRRQSIALLSGILPPIGTNLWFYVASLPVDPTPFGFVAMSFILAWALFRGGFLDLVPVGRERVLSDMDDAVVTLDAEERVVDYNPAARRLFDADSDSLGTPAPEFFAAVPELHEQYREGNLPDAEISVTRDGRTQHFDLDTSFLQGPADEQAGRLVVLREITTLKEREQLLREREQTLREREQELDLLRQVLTRILRHNIRNDLAVVRGYGEVFAEELDDRHREMAETLLEKTDDLIEISAKARTIEQLVDEDQTTTEFDLAAMLEEVVASVEASFPAVSITLAVPEACVVEATPSLELAFENLVENAVEHNDSDDPTVKVELDCQADEAVVTITDDGPGIPEHELATLEAGEEKPLQHGSGIGLWVVQWVIDEAAATIAYETGPDGTTITIRVPR